jgi:hypothetical protein
MACATGLLPEKVCGTHTKERRRKLQGRKEVDAHPKPVMPSIQESTKYSSLVAILCLVDTSSPGTLATFICAGVRIFVALISASYPCIEKLVNMRNTQDFQRHWPEQQLPPSQGPSARVALPLPGPAYWSNCHWVLM